MQLISESCPLCGTELSKIKFREIQATVKEQEREKLAEQKQRLAEAEVSIRLRLEQEFKKALQAEKDAAAKILKQQTEEQIKKIVGERDLANKKLKEAEAREAEIRKGAEQAAEKKSLKELAAQRAALDKDKELSLLKLQAEFNREREAIQKKVKLMEQQLQRRTANELGDGGEIDVFEALREAFPGDRITRIKKGEPGADILHEVLHKGQECGKILIESKVRKGWKYDYITKLRQDQVDEGAEHAILATSVFPAGKKEMCIDSDIIVINPARVVHIVQVLRQAMVTMHVRGLSMKERAGKMSKLYRLITSEAYGRKFSEAGKLTEEILDLDVQEKKAHDNVWKRRGTFAMRINHVLREIETDVAAVIEGLEETAEEGYGVESVKMASAGAALAEEALAWKRR